MSANRGIVRWTVGKWQYAPALIAMVLVLLALLFIWHEIERNREADLRHLFDHEAQRISTKIEERMSAYSQILRAGGAFFAGSEQVNREEWHRFVKTMDLDHTYRGIQGVGFSVFIPQEKLAEHVAQIRQQGFVDYGVSPPGSRENYSSIIYLEPFSGRNLRAFGFDMLSEPTRHAAMTMARDRGDVTFSGKVRLIQETQTDIQPGILAYYPIYKHGSPTQTVTQRRNALIGWVYSPYRTYDLFTPMLAQQLTGVRLEVFDGNGLAATNLLFDSEGLNEQQKTKQESPGITTVQKLQLNGRAWTLRYTALPDFARSQQLSSLWVDKANLTVIGILALGLTLAVVRVRARATKLANHLTASLRQSESQLREAQNLAKLGNWHVRFGKDQNGDVWYISKELRHLWGYTDDTLITMDTGIARMPPEDQVLAKNCWDAAKAGKGPNEWMHRIIVDDQIRWMRVVAKFTFDEHGNAVEASGTNQDITEQKNLEDAREEALNRLLNIARNLPGVVYQFRLRPDGSSCFPFSSDAMQQIYGLTPEEVREDATRVFERLHPDDYIQVIASIQESARALTPWRLDYRVKYPDGRVRWLSGHALPQREADGGTLWHGFISDVTERKQIEEKMAELNRDFVELLENTGDFIYFKDRDSRILFCSQTMAKITRHANWRDMIGKHDLEIFPIDTARIYYEEELPIFNEGKPLLNKEDPYFDEFGQKGWVSTSKWPVKDATGAVVGLFGISRDITERKQNEAKLRLAANVFTHSREGIMITDPDVQITDVNEAFTRITGYSRADVLGQKPSLLSSGRQSPAFYKTMWRDLNEQGYWGGEIWNRRKNGDYYAALLTISAVRDTGGQTTQYVGFFSDITQFKEQEQRLNHIAHYDPLTSLPNRLLFVDRLHQAMAQAQRRNDYHMALAYIDLDGFKAVNDNHGHEAGDMLLITVASRMKQTLREGDTLVRLGGDEFVAILIDLENTNACVPMLSRLLDAASTPVVLGETSLQVSASIGVSFYPQDKEINADQLLRQADRAMYQAKLAGKNQYRIFDENNDEANPD